MSPALTSIAPNLWTAERPFKLPLILGDIGTRMTIVKLADGGLFLHSPVPLDAETKAALDEIGAVQAIVAPSKAHHLFAGDYVKEYPGARLYGAPGLPDKRRDLKFDSILTDTTPPHAQGQTQHQPLPTPPFLTPPPL